VSDNGAEIGLGTGGNVVRRASVHHTAKKQLAQKSKPRHQHILRLHELNSLTGPLTAKQVAVFGSLLHNSSVDSIALLENLLGRGPLGNEAGKEGRGAGFVNGLADAVEGVGTGDGADRDVQAALLSGHAIVS
jgi:hypothetical protein